MWEHPNFRIACRLWQSIADADACGLRTLLAPKTRWTMPGHNPLAGCHVGVDAVLAMMALTGELSDELEANLVEVFVSDRGAVLRYGVRARRGRNVLDTEQLLLIRVEQDRISEALFAPVDQRAYDAFWRTQ